MSNKQKAAADGSRELTPKQRLFVEEYLIDLNATAAAARAGYRDPNIGRQLITKNNVAAAIAAGQIARSERIEITQDQVLADLDEVRGRCMQKIPVLDKRGQPVKDNQGRNMWVFDSRGALKALELLGKHLGMFTDRHEVTGKDGGPILPMNLGDLFPAGVLETLTDEELDALAGALEKTARPGTALAVKNHGNQKTILSGDGQFLRIPDNGRGD